MPFHPITSSHHTLINHTHSPSLHGRPSNRTLLCRRILRHTRMRRNLLLMILQRRIRNRAHSPSVLLLQSGVLRWEMCVYRSHDRASSVREGVLCVGVLEGRARGGVHGFFVVGGDVGV